MSADATNLLHCGRRLGEIVVDISSNNDGTGGWRLRPQNKDLHLRAKAIFFPGAGR